MLKPSLFIAWAATAIAVPVLSEITLPAYADYPLDQSTQTPPGLLQSPVNPTTLSVQTSTSTQDQLFVTQAVQASLTEVTLSRLAVQKAVDPEVRAFAQRMIQDHTQTNTELSQLASQKRYVVPTALTANSREVQQRLSSLTGSQFEQAYMNQMVSDHQKTVALFEQQVQQGQDPDLQAWTQKNLPILSGHLEDAIAIRQKLLQFNTN